jgi:hypothetical protein
MKKVILALCLLLTGCNADLSRYKAYGHNFKVTLYSATGQPIREWFSDGKVMTEQGSDGWYFRDKATGLLIRVSGPVVVEQID